MRIFIMLTVIALIQILSLGLAWGIVWLVRPVWQISFVPIAIICLIVGNAVVFGGMATGMFRLSANYLAVLWLIFLSALVSASVILALKQLGISNGYAFRGLAVVSILSLMGLAYWNAYATTIRHVSIKVNKPMAVPVRLLVASDLHLGELFGNKELQRLATIIKNENIDVMLMPGDIMDDTTEKFEQLAMADNFKTALTAPKFGSVVTLGNHDLYQPQAYASINKAINKTGATLLNDQTKTLIIEKDGKSTRLEFIGRFDDHFQERLATKELIQKVDSGYPVILLDHRPSQIDENSELPIDLQVSGHTHKGQIFPANFIVNVINRVGYGHKTINNTNFVVSSGYGFWGVPFRLGSRSEVWVIELSGIDEAALTK